MNVKISSLVPDDTTAKLTFNGTAGEMRELLHDLKGFTHPNSKAVNDFLNLTVNTINEKLGLGDNT
jgi:hypothetical protein